MRPQTAVRLARLLHRFVPFAQLRTANRIGKMLNGDEVVMETVLYGYRAVLDLRRSESRLLLIQGEDWVEDAPDLSRYIRPGMTVFDIGANIGYVTLLMSRLVGESGRVYAFEPAKENYAALKGTIAANSISQCVPINAAVGDSCGLVPFTSANNGFVDQSASDTVAITSLDEFVGQNGIKRVEFVKIDVEGFELHVLKGMRRTMTEFRPALHVEIHPQGFCGCGDPVGVASYLRERYRSMEIYIPASSLTRRERWTGKVLHRGRRKPVTVEYLYAHPEQRYFAVCV